MSSFVLYLIALGVDYASFIGVRWAGLNKKDCSINKKYPLRAVYDTLSGLALAQKKTLSKQFIYLFLIDPNNLMLRRH